MLAGRAFPLAHAPRKIDLVVVSVAELGFPREASRAAIFARAEELGLQLCPPEVGPLYDMIVGNGGTGQSLIAGNVRPDQTFSWNVVLVFAQKRSDESITAWKSRRAVKLRRRVTPRRSRPGWRRCVSANSHQYSR